MNTRRPIVGGFGTQPSFKPTLCVTLKAMAAMCVEEHDYAPWLYYIIVLSFLKSDDKVLTQSFQSLNFIFHASPESQLQDSMLNELNLYTKNTLTKKTMLHDIGQMHDYVTTKLGHYSKHLIYGLTRTGTLKAPSSAMVDARIVIDDDTIQRICDTFHIAVPKKNAGYEIANYTGGGDNTDDEDEGGQTDTTVEMTSSDDDSSDTRLRLRLRV